MKVKYQNGKSLDNSFFLLNDGNEKIKVKASQVMPLPAQMRVKAGRDNEVYSPEEMTSKMEDEFSSIDEFKQYAKNVVSKNKITAKKLEARKKRLARIRARRKYKSRKEKSSKKKVKASYKDWSIDESELPGDVNKKQDVNLALDKSELKGDRPDVKTTLNSDVKKYYSRLPSRSVGTDPEEAIDRKSSLKKKIKAQASKIKELRKKLQEKDSEVKQEKQKQARKEKAEKLDAVLETMAKKGKLDLENEQEREKAIKKYSDMDNKSLDLVIEMLQKEDSTSREANKIIASKNKNIPGNFSQKRQAKRKNNVETMADIWADSTKPSK